MKILLIGDYPPPQGGLAVHVQQLHQFLRSRDVEVRVLDLGKGGRPAPDVFPVRHPAQYARGLIDAVRRGYTVHLHTSGNNPKSWGVAASASVPWPRSPRVVTLHSGLIPDYLAASAARRAFARVALAGYSRVVAVSKAVREALLDCGVPGSKVVVQPAFLAFGVRPGAVPDGFDAARARRRPLLAMAHHPSPVYGRELMFRALRRVAESLPEVGLAVYGPGSRSEAFTAAAREAGVEHLIENFGELPQAQALAVVAQCDAFIRPTTHDGDALSVREALALGVRCVASDVCVRPEGTWLFRSGDADALAQRVLRALDARPRALFSEDAGPRLLELYRQLGGARLLAARPQVA